MNKITAFVLVLAGGNLFADPINLHKAARHNQIDVFNRELTLLKEKRYEGIRLSKDYGEGVAWLKDVEFTGGSIEFDVRGENVKQHSFVGLAFFGVNDSTFDAVYLRPFQFKEVSKVLRNHSIQYISLPTFTWRVLRGEYPEQYENAIDPSPDPDSWVHIKIVVEGNTISTYVNGASTPSLIVNSLSKTKGKKVGFYVADTSGGDFANITVVKD